MLDAGCVKWRQTGACSPDGPREPENDKECDEYIQKSDSGFCECINGQKVMQKGCNKKGYDTCKIACATLGNCTSFQISKLTIEI